MKLMRQLQDVVNQEHAPLGPDDFLPDGQDQSNQGDDDGQGVEENVDGVADDPHRVRVLSVAVFEGREDEVEAGEETL